MTTSYINVLQSYKKMNPQIQQALSTFSTLLSGRHSVLTEVDTKKVLDKDAVVEKVKASVLSLYEERCVHTGQRKMSWIFNRDTGTFIINRIYKASNLGYKK